VAELLQRGGVASLGLSATEAHEPGADAHRAVEATSQSTQERALPDGAGSVQHDHRGGAELKQGTVRVVKQGTVGTRGKEQTLNSGRAHLHPGRPGRMCRRDAGGSTDIKAGLQQRRCEECGLQRWRGQDLPLALDHVNGDHTNIRLTNLRILCPNCHALTDTWCARNRKPA
jgi:hypothetical protein